MFIIAFALLVCSGGPPPGIDLVFNLLFGWIAFLGGVIPTVHFRWGLIASACMAAMVLLVGAHSFLNWLHFEVTKAGRGDRWRWSWSVTCFFIIALTFLSGMAVIGIAHQTAWLALSPEPLAVGGDAAWNRIFCSMNLRMIDQALRLYASDHDGAYPDDLKALVSTQIFPNAKALICPATLSWGTEKTWRSSNSSSRVKRGRIFTSEKGSGSRSRSRV